MFLIRDSTWLRMQLRAWGVNDKRYGNAEPLHKLIERRVEARPEAVALIFGDTELSYGELNRRSNRLAHRLIGLGVEPETKVGIAVERSIDMVVGLLAILKAGGAYVPLDPEYPQERFNYMVADSAVGLLLTQSHIRSRIPHSDQCPVLELDGLDLEDEFWPGTHAHVRAVWHSFSAAGRDIQPRTNRSVAQLEPESC